jgi:predicted phage terminase large subunit-like protein
VPGLSALRRSELQSQIALTDQERAVLEYTWPYWARPNQLEPPGGWTTWLVMAGRAFGKTRAGSEWVRYNVEQRKASRIALVARTAADVRDVIVEGESGILAVSPPWCKPVWHASKRRLTWPNGAIATTYSAEEPDSLRGPQHDLAWADELAAWQYPDAWDQLQFGLRLGSRPRTMVTTTPRPIPLIKALISSPNTHVTRGSTYENKANLADAFVQQIIAKYEGTRLGRQELDGEILDDTPGALWTRDLVSAAWIRNPPALRRTVVAVDPAVSSGERACETGIIVAGVGTDDKVYVIEDLSGNYSPSAWASVVIQAYHRHQADRIVAESNQGGALVESNIRAYRDPATGQDGRNVAYRAVHASKGKRARAEPVAALYEQHRVHHVGALHKLEDQMVTWDASTNAESPDRVDALVWAITDLVLGAAPAEPVKTYSQYRKMLPKPRL